MTSLKSKIQYMKQMENRKSPVLILFMRFFLKNIHGPRFNYSFDMEQVNHNFKGDDIFCMKLSSSVE